MSRASAARRARLAQRSGTHRPDVAMIRAHNAAAAHGQAFVELSLAIDGMPAPTGVSVEAHEAFRAEMRAKLGELANDVDALCRSVAAHYRGPLS